MKWEVGQKVYVVKTGNLARNRKPEELGSFAVVESVGNKYFTLADYLKCKFHIDTGREKTDFSCNMIVYPSKEEHDRSVEYDKLYQSIRNHFVGYGRYSPEGLEMLRTISKILEANQVN